MANNNVLKLNDCYGCGVCVISCPHKIISIKENYNGFYEPVIANTEACTNCGLCLKSCSFSSHLIFTSKPLHTYASWSKNNGVRLNASSGGVAYELSKYALSKGYKVCAVIYDNHRAIHQIITNNIDLQKTLGSKYIPSFSVPGFTNIDFRPNSNEKYLVFGTPCQIASLRLLVIRMKCEENFILVDLFCHGVPSLKVWDKYLNETGLLTDDISEIRWRDKKFGWHNSYYIKGITTGGKEIYRSEGIDRDCFFQFFLNHYALNVCCMDKCKFKKEKSLADIRIGDLWGNKYKNDQKGVNGIICFTKKGSDFVTDNSNLVIINELISVVMEGQMAVNAKKPVGYSISTMLLDTKLTLSQILSLTKIFESIQSLPKRIIHKTLGWLGCR